MYKTIRPGQLTQRQLSVLGSIKPGDIVRDIRLLRKLSILGVLKLHEHTGQIVRHCWGMLVRAWYIDETETFEIEGVGIFRQSYISGSIFPYLTKAKTDESGNVIWY